MYLEKFKELIQKKGLSVGALADNLGLAPQTVSEWISGKKEPYEAVRANLCQALGCQVSDLFGGKQTPADEIMPPPVEAEPPVTETADKEITPKTKTTPEKKASSKTAPAKIRIPESEPAPFERNTIISASKKMRPFPKPLAKNADRQAQLNWINELSTALMINIGEITAIARTSDETPERYRKLMDVASTASDEAIELAIAVMKKCK